MSWDFDPVQGQGYSTVEISISDIITTESCISGVGDNAIRYILSHYGNRTLSTGVNIVDPTWLALWDGRTLPSPLPWFLMSRSDSSATGTPLRGLAIPFGVGGWRWTTIYVNFEARGAVYFDSLDGCFRDTGREAERKMRAFFKVFEIFFQGSGEFRWEVDGLCARQADYYSCGIYTVRNCLDLLEGRRPSGDVFTEEEVGHFRRNGGELLRRKRIQMY
ncbi:hypothetical protein ACEPPN_014060 [Leptodophora sp. 'Broadleaf-Isolate-01']